MKIRKGEIVGIQIPASCVVTGRKGYEGVLIACSQLTEGTEHANGFTIGSGVFGGCTTTKNTAELAGLVGMTVLDINNYTSERKGEKMG